MIWFTGVCLKVVHMEEWDYHDRQVCVCLLNFTEEKSGPWATERLYTGLSKSKIAVWREGVFLLKPLKETLSSAFNRHI